MQASCSVSVSYSHQALCLLVRLGLSSNADRRLRISIDLAYLRYSRELPVLWLIFNDVKSWLLEKTGLKLKGVGWDCLGLQSQELTGLLR